MGRVGAAGDDAAMASFSSLLQKGVLDRRRRWVTRARRRAVPLPSARVSRAAMGEPSPEVELAIDAAMAAADAYMEAFNARDQEAMADSCNFPHVRIASGNVVVWHDREQSIVPGMFDMLEQIEGWHHSRWDHRDVIHARPDKVHLDVCFTRFDLGDEPLGTYPSIWVMTLDRGHWGIQARSSFAA
jgi:hypothetical protein